MLSTAVTNNAVTKNAIATAVSTAVSTAVNATVVRTRLVAEVLSHWDHTNSGPGRPRANDLLERFSTIDHATCTRVLRALFVLHVKRDPTFEGHFGRSHQK